MWLCREESTEGTASRPPRLKGKARTLAKKATINTAIGDEHAYPVKIPEFLPLAQCIARSTKPRIVVPEAFIYVLRQAIRQRKWHQDQYRSLIQTPVITKNHDGHEYFIGVLERVQEILQPNFPTNAKLDSQRPEIQPDNDFIVSNKFEHLTLEEITETSVRHEVEEEPAAPAATAATVNAKFTSDPSASRDEAFLAAACFFADLHTIRKLVSSLWRLYQEGQMDLVSVSLTTNTAIDFARHLRDDFYNNFASHLQLDELPCLYCAYQRDVAGQSDPGSGSQDTCLALARKILKILLRDQVEDPSEYVPCVVPAYMGLYPETANQAFQTYQIAMGVISEFYVLIRYHKSIQAEHEVMRGLRELLLRKKLPFWLIFGVQILLDIRHILREKVTRGFADLCHGAKIITGNIERVLSLHTLASNGKSPDVNFQSLSDVLDLVGRWTQKDNVDMIRRSMQADPTTSDAYPPFYLLKRDPLWCGLLLYNFKIVAHEGAIVTANSWSSIQAAAHMYNCVQQANLASERWLDLERLLSAQGDESVFVGTRPKQPKDCAKHFALAIGTSAASLKSIRKNHPIEISRQRGRKLKTLAKVLWMFKHRYCDNSGRVNLSPSEVEDALPTARQTSSGNAGIKIHQLLAKLAITLHFEAGEMTFDYFEMHMVCWRLLRRLYAVLGPRMTDWSEFARDERHLPAFIFYLLIEEARTDMLGPAVHSTIFCDAAQIVSDMIVEEGERVVTKRSLAEPGVLKLEKRQEQQR